MLVETLDQTKNRLVINISEIARKAGTTDAVARDILGGLIGPENISSKLKPSDRFRLATETVRLGMIQEVARALTWQEFEAFTEDCLIAAGFQTQRGLIIKDATRRWQIDIVARKGPMTLIFDCKHWESPNYSSKFTKPAEHQRQAMSALLDVTKPSPGSWVLPVIVTLFDPRSRTIDGVVLVSVGQLSDFLEHITPYDPDLPFIKSQSRAESSIS